MGQSLDRPCTKRLKTLNQEYQHTYSEDWRQSANNYHITPLSLRNNFFLSIILTSCLSSYFTQRKGNQKSRFHWTKFRIVRTLSFFWAENCLKREYMELNSLAIKPYRFNLVTKTMAIHKWSDIKAIKFGISYSEFE